jgi:hypothetical protein
VSIQGEATCSVGDKTIEMVLWLSETSFLKHLGYTCMIFDALSPFFSPSWIEMQKISCIMLGTLLPGVLDCVKRCSRSKRIKVLYNHCHLHHGNTPQPPWQGMKFSIGSWLIQSNGSSANAGAIRTERIPLHVESTTEPGSFTHIDNSD